MKTARIILYPLLWALSAVYAAAVYARRYLYARGILKARKLSAKVLCVGNITAGGTGKTTSVIYVANALAAKGHKCAVLTRGYKSKGGTGTPRVVSDGKQLLLGVEEAGDEPYLLAQNLKGTPVIIGRDRYAGGMLASREFNPGVILMDDGFQHWQLYRDADLVLVDCLNPFGGGKLLPLGFLREPVSALRRAKAVLLTHCDLVSESEIGAVVEKIRKVQPGAVLVKSRHAPVFLKNYASGEQVGLDWLKNSPAAALSSVGNPAAFEMTLESLVRGPLAGRHRFLDHHWYTGPEIRAVLERNKCVVTTEKDAVRIGALKDVPAGQLAKLFVLYIKLEIMQGDDNWLENILR